MTIEVPWSEIQGFDIWSYGWFNRCVRMEFVPGYKSAARSRLGGGATGMVLGIGWSMGPKALVKLLNAARERWAEAEAGRD